MGGAVLHKSPYMLQNVGPRFWNFLNRFQNHHHTPRLQLSGWPGGLGR